MENSFESLPEVIKPQELAEYLRVNVQTVVRALKSGKLKGFKAGHDWRIHKADAAEYIGMQNRG